MKTDLHPTYYSEVPVKCACGKTFTVGSTKQSLDVEVCSACHPLYTGSEGKKVLAGRLDQFRKKQEKAAQQQAAKKRSPGKEKPVEAAEANESEK